MQYINYRLYCRGCILVGEKLLFLGVALMLIEAFIPGFGVFGVSGILTFIVGIVLVSPNIYYAIAIIAVVVGIFAIIFALIAKKIPKGSLYKTLFLKTNLNNEEGFLSSKDNNKHLGEVMIVDTFLRPSGKVKKDDNVYDAMSEGEFIEKNEKVKVVGNKGYILIVKKLEGE